MKGACSNMLSDKAELRDGYVRLLNKFHCGACMYSQKELESDLKISSHCTTISNKKFYKSTD